MTEVLAIALILSGLAGSYLGVRLSHEKKRADRCQRDYTALLENRKTGICDCEPVKLMNEGPVGVFRNELLHHEGCAALPSKSGPQ